MMDDPRIDKIEIDPDSAPLDERDRDRLARVEPSLARGLAAREWWRASTLDWHRELTPERLDAILRSGTHPQRFRLLASALRSSRVTQNYGFFDRMRTGGRVVEVQGLALQTFFDRPKLEALERTLASLELDETRMARSRSLALDGWRDSLREFALNYFLRLSSYRVARVPYVDPKRRPIDTYLQPFSLAPQVDEDAGRRDFDYSQLYYRRRENGRIGKFRLVDRHQIDLRDIYQRGKFTWIVVALHASKSMLELKPAGADRPFLTVPLDGERLGIISPELITREDRSAEDDCRGRYGFGYAYLDQHDAGSGDEPDLGFEELTFLVRRNGGILGSAVSVHNRQRQILGLPRDPLTGFVELTERVTPRVFQPLFEPIKRLAQVLPAVEVDPLRAYATLADALSGGRAARELGISREQWDRNLLTDQAIQFSEMLAAGRGTWRVVIGWNREEDLPDWVRFPTR